MNTKEKEVFKRTMFLQFANFNSNHKECLCQAINELGLYQELKDIYNIYGITYDEYIEDMSNAYLRYKSQIVSKMWHKNALN